MARAQAERKRADEEVARQKADAEAKAKADADAKAKAEAATTQKAEMEAKQRLEDERKKAEADAAAEKKAAEAVENALRLTTIDRQRLQVALTSLGFDTRGTDGAFGPRSREMIAGWQKARNQLPTGFLSDAQRQALLREAVAAVGKYDDDQKKIEEEKKKADEEAKKKAEEEAKKKAEEEAKGRDTGPEKAVRSLAHGMGYRSGFTAPICPGSQIWPSPAVAQPYSSTGVSGMVTVAHAGLGCLRRTAPIGRLRSPATENGTA